VGNIAVMTQKSFLGGHLTIDKRRTDADAGDQALFSMAQTI
jgi:hypothetical protein